MTQPTGVPVDRPKPVQNPLTLIMKIKSDADYRQLRQILDELNALPLDRNPVIRALMKIGTVHFARFTFLENNTKLAVITTYDGDFDAYVNEFVNEIGDVFNRMLAHIEDAPPLPVQQHRTEFLRYVKEHDLPSATFFSAYPRLTVLDIQSLDEHGP